MEGELNGLREELVRLTKHNEKLSINVQAMEKQGVEKDHHSRELKRNLDVRANFIQEQDNVIS